jgi:hypothetical protein
MAKCPAASVPSTSTSGTSYFIKDLITKKERLVEHCPTGNMPADFFTKPLQGQLFFKFRKAIMNE